MRDNFRPNVRLATNILMVIGTLLIAFNLSKMSTVNIDQPIKEDCARVIADGWVGINKFVKKYKLVGDQNSSYPNSSSFERFCGYYLK